MNCNYIETLMMKYFDGKNLKRKESCELAKHILVCENCRELYLIMDESAECEITNAPANFTASVMEKVSKLPVYTPKAKTSILPRVIAALNICLFAIGYMFALDPELLYYLPQPLLDNILNTLSVIGGALNATAEWVAMYVNPNIGITALLFVALTGTLLFVLQSGEKAKV